jgi:hypothetical protein
MAYDASDSLSALSTGIGGIAAFGTAWEQASALRSQGEFQLAMARINQKFSDMEADQVIRQGNYQAHEVRKRGEKIAGSQRAAAAAQGIDVNDAQGSAAALVDDTKLAEANDVARAHTNAWMQAWGIKTQARLNVDSAEANKAGANFAANQTLLTGGLKLAASALKTGSIYARGSKTPDTGGTLLGTNEKAFKPEKYTGWWMTPSKDEEP